MKAAVLTAINEPLELKEVQTTDLQFGQVLVQIITSGICGAQLQEIRGEKGAWLPRLMGHEGCGRVLEIGPGVTHVKVGQKVVMHWRMGEGIESQFPEYIVDGQRITSGRITTFSEQAIVSENRLTPVPEETPNELAALLGCGLSTALGTIEKEANLLMGESILIVGCGGLGLNLIRSARMRLAGRIHAHDISKDKCASSNEAGADEFFPWLDSIQNQKYDVIVDTTGNPDAIADTIPLLAPSGRYIMVGQPGPKQGIMLHGARHFFEGTGKTLKATQGGGFNPTLEIPRYVGLWRSGQLKLEGIISHRLNLDKINEGLDLVRNGQAGRVMIECV